MKILYLGLIFLGALLSCASAEGIDQDTGPADTAYDLNFDFGAADLDVNWGDIESDVPPDVDLDLNPDPDLPDLPDIPDIPSYPAPSLDHVYGGIHRKIFENFDDLIFNILPNYPVKVYLTLITATFFHDQNIAGNRGHNREANLLVQSPDEFINNVVVPFVSRYKDSDSIFAIDIINEVEAMIHESDGNRGSWGFSWAEMQNFIKKCAAAIHQNTPFYVSSSSGWHNHENVMNGRFENLGLDFYDYHYYKNVADIVASTVMYQNLSEENKLPILIGEYGQDLDDWDDNLQYNVAAGVLSATYNDRADNFESKGYIGALSWYYDFIGSTNRLANLNPDGTFRKIGEVFTEYGDKSENFFVGTNLAWFSGACTHDFGPNINYPGWGNNYSHDGLVEIMEKISSVGLKVLRIWVFEGEEGLVINPFIDHFTDNQNDWVIYDVNTAFSFPNGEGYNGSTCMKITINANAARWYGVKILFPNGSPLNLDFADTWTYHVRNSLGIAAGVNLYFKYDNGSSWLTVQTRSGEGAQVWLANGASADATVSLSATNFNGVWGWAHNSSLFISRPESKDMSLIREIGLRVYLNPGVNGSLYLDNMKIFKKDWAIPGE